VSFLVTRPNATLIDGMPSPREPLLPDGIKDLVEMIELREQENREHRQQLMQLKSLIEQGDLVLAILAELRRRIDQDLLFTEHFELVSPHLYQVTCQKWDVVLASHPLAVTTRTYETIIELTVQVVWALICTTRARHIECRDEGGRLEF
jgi:hypothetical protein